MAISGANLVVTKYDNSGQIVNQVTYTSSTFGSSNNFTNAVFSDSTNKDEVLIGCCLWTYFSVCTLNTIDLTISNVKGFSASSSLGAKSPKDGRISARPGVNNQFIASVELSSNDGSGRWENSLAQRIYLLNYTSSALTSLSDNTTTLSTDNKYSYASQYLGDVDIKWNSTGNVVVCRRRGTGREDPGGRAGQFETIFKIENNVLTIIRDYKVTNNSNTTYVLPLDDNYWIYGNKVYALGDTSTSLSNSPVTVTYHDTEVLSNMIFNLASSILYTYTYEGYTVTADDQYNQLGSFSLNDKANRYIQINYSTNSTTLYYFALTDVIMSLTRGLHVLYNTEDSTSTSDDILATKTAYNSTGKIVGTMPNNGAVQYTPSASTQNIANGYHNGSTIVGDANLVSANIRSGVTIFGVQGNLEPDKPDQTKTVTPTTSQQIVEPDIGYELSSVIVEATDISHEDYVECQELADLILGDTTVTDLDYVLMNSVVLNDTINADVIQEDDENILVVNDDTSL